MKFRRKVFPNISGHGQIEVASVKIPNSGHSQMEEIKSSIKEMRMEIRRLRENVECQNMRSRHESRFASIFVISFLFAANIWCVKNGKTNLLELI